ncbi:MAG: hypothetical protein H0T46_18155 [Deltaproteobacteria bacterium]|nr:hypothetical protein [Deltaproteobacteria bacterium]
MSLSRIWWVLALHLVLVTSASAGPKRVLVLPLDGSADPSARGKLNLSVQKLAKDGAAGAVVTIGDATFDEAAAAVGCDPATPKCAVSVRQTLGVDELVYGTVTADPTGQTIVVIRRSSATDNPPKDTTVVLGPTDPPGKAERELAPIFGVAPRDTTVTRPQPLPLPPGPPEPRRDNTKRNIGIACASGGGVMLLIGLVLWNSASGKQDEVDSAPTRTVADLMRLQDLEDRTQTLAITGDVMVLLGLGLGGYGAWVLYTDSKENRTVVVAPTATPAGPGVAIGGTW